MKVVCHPADRGACGLYRLEFPAKALQAQGHDVKIAYDFSYKRVVWQDTIQGPTVRGLDQDIDADVVVFQRPLRRNRVEFIDVLQAEGIAVVVEVDDDFHAIHPRNPAWRGTNPLQDPDMNRDWLMKACKRADLVTVSTPALAERYGQHGRVVVLPNYVPEWYTFLSPGAYTETFLERPKGLLVGWSGSVATHPDDLQVCGDAVRQVCAETGARFHVIGTGVKVAERLNLEEDPTATGWLPIKAYPEGLAQLDVGIVPLAPTNFNEAKSWLKGLEYASVGVPFVASPTGPYRELAKSMGWTAETPDAWYRHLRALLTDHVLRCECSESYRDLVAERFTVEKNAWKWADAWDRALEYRAAA